jgi:hypothetical protein
MSLKAINQNLFEQSLLFGMSVGFSFHLRWFGNMKEVKLQLKKACCAYLENKISVIERAIDAAQHDANSQTKSSAGDKHETGRAMMHLEQERQARQLNAAFQNQRHLSSIDFAGPTNFTRLGSLVSTSIGKFFLAISAGTFDLNGERYMSISLDSPLGQELEDSEAGDIVLFRGKEIEIYWVV